MSKPFICHDFKSPRTDMSRRLPGTMKVVPLLFYGVLSLTAYFGVRDVLDLKSAEREKQASIIFGKSMKTYGFADGHSELKNEPPEGFDAWEKQHMIQPPSQ